MRELVSGLYRLRSRLVVNARIWAYSAFDSRLDGCGVEKVRRRRRRSACSLYYHIVLEKRHTVSG
jgi:hypothetical protein